jgi:RNA polymerase sigma factor (sigma-70 family)
MQEAMMRPAPAEPWPDEPVEMLRRLYPLLLRTARDLVPTKQQAEDLVQEALVRTLVRHPDLGELDHPLGYTRTVVWRLAYSERKARGKEIPIEACREMEAQAPDPSDASSLREALMALPLGQRSCVALRYLYGCDDDTIAIVLGCRTSTVRSQMARGLAHLRGSMEGWIDENR